MKTLKPSENIDKQDQIDQESFKILSIALIAFILCVTIGCIVNKEHPQPSSIKPKTQPSIEIPADLKICRDTNGPIDWRTNGK